MAARDDSQGADGAVTKSPDTEGFTEFDSDNCSLLLSMMQMLGVAAGSLSSFPSLQHFQTKYNRRRPPTTNSHTKVPGSSIVLKIVTNQCSQFQLVNLVFKF